MLIKSLKIIFYLCLFLSYSMLSAEEVRTEQKYEFKIGLILAQTGPWAEFGEAQSQAIKLALEDYPNKFSNIRFITEDSRGNGKDAVTAYNKLHSIDKVDLTFVWGVEPALAVAPLAEQNKTPLIVSAIVSSTARNRKYVIRTINYAEQQAQTILKYFRTKGIKKIAIIKAQMSFYDILIEGMKKNLHADESIEVIEDLLPTDNDFKRVVTKSKKMKFDMFGMFLSPTQILSFLKEAKIQKFDASFFGASPFQSHTLIKQAKGMMDNSIFFHNDVSQEFETKYIERFKNDIQIPWAANAYDFVTLSSELFNNLETKPTTEKILELYSQDRIHNGAGSSYHYVNSPTEGKFFEYPIVVKKIIGQNFQEVFRNAAFSE